MEKKKISKRVFYICTNKEPIYWKDVKDFQFEDNDHLEFGYVEPWENGSDNSGGDHYQAEVYRDVLETDEQFQKRIKDTERDKKWLKQRRYANYLKLKEEFENEEKDTLE